MEINKIFCKACGNELEICEGDVMQIFQENLDVLEATCPECDYPNDVKIINTTVKLEVVN